MTRRTPAARAVRRVQTIAARLSRQQDRQDAAAARLEAMRASRTLVVSLPADPERAAAVLLRLYNRVELVDALQRARRPKVRT